jgi:hypothetical protein
MRCQVTPPSSSGQRRSIDTADDREVVVAKIDGNDEDIDPLLAGDANSEMSHDDGILHENARENLALHVIDCIKTATLEAERAKKEATPSSFMVSEHLDAPPDVVWDAFLAVMGDPFHGMKRPRADIKDEYKKPYYVALMLAWFQWDDNGLKRVKDIQRENGFSNNDIDSLMYFKPSFFSQRVERKQLPPSQLYWRVRAVFVAFGTKMDSSTGRPLFNKGAWAKAKNILKEIQ